MIALAVDDDIVSRMALVDLLAGFPRLTVVEAEDGESAWERLTRGPLPLLCCCDIRMPRLSGIALLRRLKGSPRLADLPLIVVSPAADRATVQEALQLGAAGYILKPFKAHEARAKLAAIVDKALDGRAEKAARTTRRLDIAPERLLHYLAALIRQLETALLEVDARQRADFDSLHTGCVTLGLWRAAGLLERLPQDPAAAEGQRILADVHAMASEHLAALKASLRPTRA